MVVKVGGTGQLVSFSLVSSCPSLRPLSVIPAFLGLPHLLGQWGSITDKGWASAPSPTIFLSLLFQKDKEALRSCRIPNLCGRSSTSHFALFLPLKTRRGREPEKFMGILGAISRLTSSNGALGSSSFFQIVADPNCSHPDRLQEENSMGETEERFPSPGP